MILLDKRAVTEAYPKADGPWLFHCSRRFLIIAISSKSRYCYVTMTTKCVEANSTLITTQLVSQSCLVFWSLLCKSNEKGGAAGGTFLKKIQLEKGEMEKKKRYETRKKIETRRTGFSCNLKKGKWNDGTVLHAYSYTKWGECAYMPLWYMYIMCRYWKT